MNNLFLKKNLTIKGAGGGGGGGGQAPPPPDVTQYPAVLAPPQFSNLNTINSFSYAEIIDLISDGPIEGLVNRNGKKVYDENIFEGIFLNETPIKETSSERRQSIPISFIRERLKKHWAYLNNINNLELTESSPRITIINPSEIDDINFTNPISITSYHPNDSVFQFIKSLNGSFDAVSLISKAFDLSPIINERPFLTKINIPKFTINLSKEKFDISEGGTNSPSPLKIGIIDLSNYIYFSIGSETLNSFNYFELPRSFINNNSSTASGKKTFKKNLISDKDFYVYEVYDLDIFIWSIYNNEVGIKNIETILDKYFSNIYVFQNDFSLFNYNLVQSEFKNGSEIQAPLKYFTNVEIDTEYGKELIGPFKICNCFNPSSALDNGGIQRVTSFAQTNSYTPPVSNTLLELETSDDIRYVQSWPIEYDCKGSPYLICNARLNYTQFDKTSSSRTAQEAVPITHYIANENVEEVFVSINVQQLYDTNHIDLVSDNQAVFGKNQGKYDQTTRIQEGVNTYGSIIGFNNTVGYTSGNIYFLVYGSTFNNGYVLDGIKITGIFDENCLICNLQRVADKDHPETLYYKTISADGLASKVSTISSLIAVKTKNSFNQPTSITYNASIENNLINYQIPNDSYVIKESFNINGYSPSTLESRLKLLNEDQSPFYCFGLAANEKITSLNISSHTIPASASFVSTFLSTSTKSLGFNFFISKVSYRTASIKELAEKAVVGHIINRYIDFSALVDDTKSIALISQVNYPNIFKYIINPYLNLNKLKYGTTISSYQENIIGNLYLIGINGSYLRSQTSFFYEKVVASLTKTFLKLNILDQLLEEFLLTTDQSSNFKNIDSNTGINYISDFSTTKALENALLKFQNGKLIGTSSIYNLKKYTVNSVPYVSDVSLIEFERNKVSAARDSYNINNIFLYRTQYFSINADDKNYDVIIYYNLYSNIAQNSTLTPTQENIKYINMEVQDDGSQQSGGTFDGAKVKQNITAGTKMPAIVVVDVETGYESKEKEVYRGNCEYFAYRYNIFGMSTENSIVDLGRKSYEFINACKLSLDRGGYVSKYRNIYSNNQPVYLFELVCCSSISSATGYYITNKKDIYIGEINLNKIESNTDYNISYITSNINSQTYNIGSEQQFTSSFNINVNGTSIQTDNKNTISENYNFLTGFLKNNKLSNQQVADYFNNNFECLDLSQSISFLRSPNGILNERLIQSNSFVVEPYVLSKSISDQNVCYFDTYVYKNTNQCLQLKIYNYFYTSYETVFVDPLWRATEVAGKSYVNFIGPGGANIESVKQDNIKLIIYLDGTTKLNSPSSIGLALKNQFKNDLILYFNNFIARFTTGAVNNTDAYQSLLNYFLGLTNWTTDSSTAITETLSSSIISDLIDNLNYINSQLHIKNIFTDTNLILTQENVRAALQIANINYKTEIKIKSTSGIQGFLAQILLYQLTGSQYFSIKNSNILTLSAIDKRNYLGSLTIKDPVTLTANFWTIYNKNNNKLSIIFKYPTRSSLYKELESPIPFLNFSQLVSQNTYKFTHRAQFWPNGYDYYDIKSYDPKACFYLRYDGNADMNPVASNLLDGTEYWFNSNTVPFSWTNWAVTQGSSFKPVKNSFKAGRFTFGSRLGTKLIDYFDSNDTSEWPILFHAWSESATSKGIISHICMDTIWRDRYIIYNINSATYFKNISESKSVNFHNPENNTISSYCLLTIPAESDSLRDVEKAFIDNGIVPPDMRMYSYETPPFYQDVFAENNWNIKYFAQINISNISYNTKNTYANDAGLRIQIPLPKNDKYGNPMRRYVKVTRRSHETLSPLIGKRVALNKITEIIPQRFSYPFSSIVGTKIDSRAFSQVPTRTFHCKLKKILVPSNYFPNNEDEEDIRYIEGNGKYKIYEGDWDGTFKLAWSNNPAWILMDLLINKRYGLGNYIESDQVDIWELYKISRWCDCVDDNGYYYGVSDGFGGVEPRHSFNALISDKFNIFDMVNQVASVFRGHVYYMNSLITFDDDRIKPIIGEFNNSDVKDGLFNYTNHKKDDEFTAVDIAYIDARDNYKPKIEYVEDSDGIRQRGILKKNINAFGVTSKAQARRFGKYFLYQTSKENTNVSFTTDNRALLYKPGDLIRINDELMNSIKNFGQIKEISEIPNSPSCFKVTIDRILDPAIYCTDQISLYAPISKPKYDDYYANAQFVPENLIFCTSSPILGSLKTMHYGQLTADNGQNYNGIYYKYVDAPFIEFKMNAFDTVGAVKSFSGVSQVRYKIETVNPLSTLILTKNETGYLTYVPNSNINGEPAKYGHWQFATGLDEKQDKLLFDIIKNQSLKYQLPYKNYFFEYFDTGRYLRFSGINEFQNTFYNSIDFDPTNDPIIWNNLPDDLNHTGVVIRESLSCFSISSYKNPTISYSDVIENDRPSIDTFSIVNDYILDNNGNNIGNNGAITGSYIHNNEVYNEYTELILSKSGSVSVKNPDGTFSVRNQLKCSVSPDLSKIPIGSSYSLNLLNKRDKNYKITSITENYINEYNITASEYNLDKFKEIEDNSEVDNLQNTFNFLTAQTQAIQSLEKQKLASPVISLRYISNLKAIEIKWTSVQNADSYDLYIQTPSKQTSNFIAKANYNNNFDKQTNSFTQIWYLPQNSEIGTYTISIQSNSVANANGFYEFSPISKRSINIMNY